MMTFWPLLLVCVIIFYIYQEEFRRRKEIVIIVNLPICISTTYLLKEILKPKLQYNEVFLVKPAPFLH